MDDLCGLTGVTPLRSVGGSVDCGPTLLMSAALFLGDVLLFSLALCGSSSQWTCAGDDASLCVGDIGDTSILLSPSFANDCKLTDLSETIVLSFKVCARL